MKRIGHQILNAVDDVLEERKDEWSAAQIIVINKDGSHSERFYSHGPIDENPAAMKLVELTPFTDEFYRTFPRTVSKRD